MEIAFNSTAPVPRSNRCSSFTLHFSGQMYYYYMNWLRMCILLHYIIWILFRPSLESEFSHGWPTRSKCYMWGLCVRHFPELSTDKSAQVDPEPPDSSCSFRELSLTQKPNHHYTFFYPFQWKKTTFWWGIHMWGDEIKHHDLILMNIK